MSTIVLTGASAGIGAAAAIELTRMGHEVVATGRSPSKLDGVHQKMVDAAPNDVKVPDAIVADFASLADVRALAATVLERCARIDVLANNAGLQTSKREESAEGYEMVLAVNHLAPFLLTDLLLDRVRESGGRIVGTSSAVHRIGRIDFDDLQMERKWSGFRAYGNSKLANILFTSELARRNGVPASCYHPGGVDTDLGRGSKTSSISKPFMKWFARTPEKGADTLVWLATEPRARRRARCTTPTASPGRCRRVHRTRSPRRACGTSARSWLRRNAGQGSSDRAEVGQLFTASATRSADSGPGDSCSRTTRPSSSSTSNTSGAAATHNALPRHLLLSTTTRDERSSGLDDE